MKALTGNEHIAELQRYVLTFEVERGFDSQSAMEKCVLLGEEVGELFRAVRSEAGIKTDPNSQRASVGEEIADVIIYLLAIANRFSIEVGQEIRIKAERNASRKWR
jgi:NTP pyrophosphatase (non-canonical NTP hydrolase)